MQGANISQAQARRLLAQGYEIYLDPNTGAWIRTDEIDADTWTYNVFRTGYQREEMPATAVRITAI